ncbi:MAG: alpha/beta hydrolase [Betaproteobacteria bacterium]|nr:alpha/beta hydrolase [Betaproteobacteria bacterium]
MRYVEWGSRDNPRVVICVHGLSRNGRDFDALAQTLQRDFRVVCPDIAGRGKSDWLTDKADYGTAQYAADITTLIARLDATHPCEIFWVGTSMGGIVGMMLAALPNTPIRRLVLNDVGGVVPKAAIGRIVMYLGKDPRFNTFKELEELVRFISAPFGPLTDAQWEHLTRHNSKQYPDGTWGFNYDPGIAEPFKNVALADVPLWQYYDAIICPTLLLRGMDSDLLLKDTALDMTQRGPRARLVQFAGVGHAPMLMSEDQIQVVRDFLLAQ